MSARAGLDMWACSCSCVESTEKIRRPISQAGGRGSGGSTQRFGHGVCGRPMVRCMPTPETGGYLGVLSANLKPGLNHVDGMNDCVCVWVGVTCERGYVCGETRVFTMSQWDQRLLRSLVGESADNTEQRHGCIHSSPTAKLTGDCDDRSPARRANL